VDLSSRPRSGAASPHRHSFDSDLRNYFLRERRRSLPSEGGDHEPRADSGASIFEFALNRYGVTLIPIVPQKEKEKLSLSKRKCYLHLVLCSRSPLAAVFGGSYKRKPSISGANNPQHIRHVEYDSRTGQFLGLPKDWEQHLTSGSSGDRWGALINNPISRSHSDSTPLEERTSLERANDSKRSTLSSTTETFYSDNSRYRQPAERPASFISTVPSTSDDFAVNHEEPREVDNHPYSHTPRPLPHTPLL
jgi:P21-Rho-binding domain